MTDFQSLVQINLQLRKQIAETKISTKVFSDRHVIRSILNELISHYTELNKNKDCILNKYYAVDSKGNWYPLSDDTIVDAMDSLLHGRISSFPYKIKEFDGTIFCHDNIIQNGLPLILFQSDETIFAVKTREYYTSHLHLFKFQPLVYGMRCRQDVAQEWLKHIDRDYIVSINDSYLIKLAALWLGCHEDCLTGNMTVDGNDIASFLELIIVDDSLKCYFLMSGQRVLFCYLQVNDSERNIKLIMPLGSIVKKVN